LHLEEHTKVPFFDSSRCSAFFPLCAGFCPIPVPSVSCLRRPWPSSSNSITPVPPLFKSCPSNSTCISSPGFCLFTNALFQLRERIRGYPPVFSTFHPVFLPFSLPCIKQCRPFPPVQLRPFPSFSKVDNHCWPKENYGKKAFPSSLSHPFRPVPYQIHCQKNTPPGPAQNLGPFPLRFTIFQETFFLEKLQIFFFLSAKVFLYAFPLPQSDPFLSPFRLPVPAHFFL